MPIIQAIWFITAALDCFAEQAYCSITTAVGMEGLGLGDMAESSVRTVGKPGLALSGGSQGRAVSRGISWLMVL